MLNRFYSYFFQPKVPVAFFSMFRIVFLVWYLVISVMKVGYEYSLVKYKTFYNPIPMLEHLGINEKIPLDYYTAVMVVLFISLVVSIEGRWAKYSLPVLALTSFIRMATYSGFFKSANSVYVIHTQNILMLLLFLLATLPPRCHTPLVQTFKECFLAFKNKKLPENCIPFFVPLVFKLTLAVAYFGAAYVRLSDTSFKWLDGHTLQGNLIDSYLTLDVKPALALAVHHELCRYLSYLFNFFEFTFFLFAFNSFSFVIGTLCAFSLHVGIFYFMGINFLTWHCVNLAVVIPDLLLVLFWVTTLRLKKD